MGERSGGSRVEREEGRLWRGVGRRTAGLEEGGPQGRGRGWGGHRVRGEKGGLWGRTGGDEGGLKGRGRRTAGWGERREDYGGGEEGGLQGKEEGGL